MSPPSAASAPAGGLKEPGDWRSSRARGKVDYVESSDGSGSNDGSAFSEGEGEEDEDDDDDSFDDSSDDEGEDEDEDEEGAKAPKKRAPRKSGGPSAKASADAGGRRKQIKWTPAWNAALIAAAEKAKGKGRGGGMRDWAMIIDEMKTVTGLELTNMQAQKRLHFLESRAKATVTGRFTDEEDDLLLKAVAEEDAKLAGGKRPLTFWAGIRDKHFPGRSTKDLTNRYKNLQKSIKKTGKLPIRESEVPIIMEVYTQFKGKEGWTVEAAKRLGRSRFEVQGWYINHRDRFPSFEEQKEA